MTRYKVQVPITYMGEKVSKGQVIDLTPAQVTGIGAGNLRASNNPVNTDGTQVASPTHDTLGEATGVSNSS